VQNIENEIIAKDFVKTGVFPVSHTVFFRGALRGGKWYIGGFFMKT